MLWSGLAKGVASGPGAADTGRLLDQTAFFLYPLSLSYMKASSLPRYHVLFQSWVLKKFLAQFEVRITSLKAFSSVWSKSYVCQNDIEMFIQDIQCPNPEYTMLTLCRHSHSRTLRRCRALAVRNGKPSSGQTTCSPSHSKCSSSFSCCS